MATVDDDADALDAAAVAPAAGDRASGGTDIEVTDEAIRTAQQALRAARVLSPAERLAALEAVHADLAARLDDVQGG